MLQLNRRIALPSRKTHSPAAPKGFDKGYFYLGLVLWIVFFAQETQHWRWPLLATLQADDLYKQLTGFVLFTYVAHQWHCSVLRSRGLMRKAGRIIKRHKVIGSLAPLFFYAHAQSLGFAYLKALSLIFFAIFLTGLFNFETTRIHKPWFQPVWITVHVGLSTGLLFLLGYHIFVSYAYQ